MARKKNTHIVNNKAIFIELFNKNLCNITDTCKATKISRRTFYNWIETDEQFRAEIAEAKEKEKDWWENRLRILGRGIPKLNEKGKIIGWEERPDTAVVIFVNKRLNRDRGYGDRAPDVPMETERRIDLTRLNPEQLKVWYELLDIIMVDPQEEALDTEYVEIND